VLNASSGVSPGSNLGPPHVSSGRRRLSTAMLVSSFYHPSQRDTFTGNLTGLVLDNTV